MTTAVLTAAFAPPPFSRREALRYAGCGADAGAEIEALLDAAVREVWDRLTYRVCYARLPVTVRGDVCDGPGLASGVRGMPCRPAQVSGRAHGMAARRARL